MINLELSKDILTDSNCWHRRFFRCWIDGSYKGQEHYEDSCKYTRDYYGDDDALRRRVISEWCAFMGREFDCSTSTVVRHMKDAFTKDEMEALNTELVDDLRDLVRWEMEDEA